MLNPVATAAATPLPPDVCLMYPAPTSDDELLAAAATAAVVNGGEAPIVTPAGAVLIDPLGNATFLPAAVVPQQTAAIGVDAYAAAYTAATFAMAPGAEHSAHKLQQQHQLVTTAGPSVNTESSSHKKIVMDYESDFPTLAPSDQPLTTLNPAWNMKSNKTMPVKSTTVTQVFQFPSEERRYLMSNEHGFGEKNQEHEECSTIMQKTDTTIDLCQNKDSSLTIVVSGKRANVEEARKLIVQSLQTQSHREIRIPKDHHRVLIGRNGQKLQQLEKETDCRIMVPNRDTASEMIRVVGPREGIEKAIHQIQLISDEQSKMAQEHLTIPKVFYPWIKGPFNETVDRMTQETGVRINIPPPTAASDIIVVTGEKEGVLTAVALIKKIYEEKKNSQTVSIQVEKGQHRFVIGPQRSGIAEILRDTDVSVEVPAEDSESKTITLRGDPGKLGTALALVYSKASSIITAEVKCPVWLHKYVIGPRGSGIRQIVGEDSSGSKVQVSFEEEGRIFLEGPPVEVKRVKECLSDIVKDLQANYTFEVLHVSPAYHRHIIGKSGANISKIRQETGASVVIPSDDSHSDEVRVEGRKEAVQQATADIMEMVKKMENEKSRDIIIENRFHRFIIGAKGESIRELRDKFPGVNIAFPEPGRKTDLVTLRGPRDEVDKCHKHLQNTVKEMKENNYQERVHIFKEFYPHIIGKNGSNIKKIREETDTKIELPLESSSTDAITLTGKKANVEKARDMLRKLESELSSIVSAEISIPQKMHAGLLGSGGRLIHHIAQTECGGVQIKFPDAKAQSDRVTLRGHKEGVDKAKRMLLDLVKDRELSSHTAEVKAKPDLFRYLIGRGGSNIQKLRDNFPSVKIVLPRHEDADQETIHLIGKKDQVESARAQLAATIAELNQFVEVHVEVDPKWYRHFVSRGASVLHEVQDQCGGVMISFPKQGAGTNNVTIKGGKECVQSAKKRILEIVDDLESQVTITVHVPQRFHGLLLANRGAKIHDITHRCRVQIQFPDRNAAANSSGGTTSRSSADQSPRTVNGVEHSPPGMNGDVDSSMHADSPTEIAVDAQDYVRISGRPERCEEAKELLLAEIPISESINVPFDFHRLLIGRNGADIRRFMERYNVNVRFPSQDQHLDEIVVTGPPAYIAEAVSAIMSRVEELEEEAKDRELKSFQTTVQVPVAFHPKLIGPKGIEINRLRAKYDVQIAIPSKNTEVSENIIITGYEKNATECKEDIERMVADLQSMYTQEFALDARVHPRIIGQRGKNIRKVMDDYNVEIRFPRSSDPNPNLIVISGKNEDQVFDCMDYLRNLEEEYLQDISERHRDPQRNEVDQSNGYKESVDLEVVGRTPWQAPHQQQQVVPDMADMSDFPAIASDSSACCATPGPKWGPAARGY